MISMNFTQYCDQCGDMILYNRSKIGIQDRENLFLDEELRGEFDFDGMTEQVICINCIKANKKEIRRK